ncbi:MAG: hypothetical protein MUC88_03220 [Planctomycetes bacterium]|nr:hypothetical protein [Planctomycetota bacterium]
MNRPRLWWGVAALLLGAVTLAGAEDQVEIGVTADIFDKYIWRGQNLLDDWVLQPGASLSYKGFTGSIWGNMDLRGEAVGEGQFNEIDFTLDYTNSVPGLDFLEYAVGVIHYDFVNTEFPATSEAYAGLAADVPLSPAVRWFYDFDELNGSYIQLSIGHTVEKIREWEGDGRCDLALGASLGYGTKGFNEGTFELNEGGWNDLTLTAGLPICFGKFTIRPTLGYSMMIDKDIRTAQSPYADNLWGGVGLIYEF